MGRRFGRHIVINAKLDKENTMMQFSLCFERSGLIFLSVCIPQVLNFLPERGHSSTQKQNFVLFAKIFDVLCISKIENVYTIFQERSAIFYSYSLTQKSLDKYKSLRFWAKTLCPDCGRLELQTQRKQTQNGVIFKLGGAPHSLLKRSPT
jgi:hypothetical protein